MFQDTVGGRLVSYGKIYSLATGEVANNKVQIKLRHGIGHKSQKENKKNTRKFQAI